MKRRALALAPLLLCMALAQEPEGGTTVNVPPPSTVTVTAAPDTPWYGNPAVLVALIGLPGGLLGGWTAYRLGLKKADSDALAQRDAADLTAIQARDKSFSDLTALLTSTLSSSQAYVAEAAASKARLEVVEQRQKEREDREREQIAKIATLEAKQTELTGHIGACLGGQPCPLAGQLNRRHA